MTYRVTYLLLFFNYVFTYGQHLLSETHIQLGELSDIHEIKAEVVITNTEEKKIFLLKADADHGLKVFTSKKALVLNDSALLVLSFIPENEGKFNKQIRLYLGHLNKPVIIEMSGNIKSIKHNDKTACYYFKKQTQPITKALPVELPTEPLKKTEKSVNAEKEIMTGPVKETVKPDVTSSPKDESLLPESIYKPNNVLFLVDVSNSMKDSLKLPLMKVALHKLIEALRESDKVTFVTYADSVTILAESIKGSEKEKLHSLTNGLKARGLTKGRQAILKSTDVLLRNYIEGGNNQILMATDGQFNFYEKDEQEFHNKQIGKPIVLSTIGFGNEKKALQNLKGIAAKGNGSFIHIKNSKQSAEMLLEEIRKRSRY